MEFSKFAQREVCKNRTNFHKNFAKRFAEDSLKCSALDLPKNHVPDNQYSEKVELELYQKKKFVDWRIFGTLNWQNTFKSVFEFDEKDGLNSANDSYENRKCYKILDIHDNVQHQIQQNIKKKLRLKEDDDGFSPLKIKTSITPGKYGQFFGTRQGGDSEEDIVEFTDVESSLTCSDVSVDSQDSNGKLRQKGDESKDPKIDLKAVNRFPSTVANHSARFQAKTEGVENDILKQRGDVHVQNLKIAEDMKENGFDFDVRLADDKIGDINNQMKEIFDKLRGV